VLTSNALAATLLTVDTAHPLARFDPRAAAGATVDAHDFEENAGISRTCGPCSRPDFSRSRTAWRRSFAMVRTAAQYAFRHAEDEGIESESDVISHA
jgi:hypothetical protein